MTEYLFKSMADYDWSWPTRIDRDAIEAALRCYHVGADVAISYRQKAFDPTHIKYWLFPEITGLTKAGRITGHFSTVPVSIHQTSITLRNVVTGQVSLQDARYRDTASAGL